MNDEFESFGKEMRLRNRIIMPEGLNKITKYLLSM
jgi:hypothetical protein